MTKEWDKNMTKRMGFIKRIIRDPCRATSKRLQQVVDGERGHVE